MKYNFDEVIDRHHTYSLKWDQDALLRATTPCLRRDNDTIRWMMEDMDFACAPEIQEALKKTAMFPTFGYTSTDSEGGWKQSVIDWYRRRYQLELKPEWILYSAGSEDSIEQAIRAYTSRGDGVIICRPVFSRFAKIIDRLGRNIANCQLEMQSRQYYAMDWKAFEETCAKPENRLFLLCSPAVPVGRVWRKAELAKMIDICRRNNVIVLADEMHAAIIRKNETHTPILSASDKWDGLILVGGADKAFNLTGLSCAYTIIPERDLRRNFTFGYRPPVSPFALSALSAAYDEGEEWLAELNEYIDGNLAYAVSFIRERMPKARVWMPEATYNLWVDFALYDYTKAELKQVINQRANIAGHSGSSFDPVNGGQFMRFSLVSPRSIVEEGMERLAAAFEAHEAERAAAAEKTDGAEADKG